MPMRVQESGRLANRLGRHFFFIGAPLRCAPAFGRVERFFSLLTRHLFLSTQARLGNMPGYYQSSRYAGLDLMIAVDFANPPVPIRGTTPLPLLTPFARAKR
jgi:hypothetical protein